MQKKHVVMVCLCKCVHFVHFKHKKIMNIILLKINWKKNVKIVINICIYVQINKRKIILQYVQIQIVKH